MPNTPIAAAPAATITPVGCAAAAPPFDMILCSALMTEEMYFLSSDGSAPYQASVVTAGSKTVREAVRSLDGRAVLRTLLTEVHSFWPSRELMYDLSPESIFEDC